MGDRATIAIANETRGPWAGRSDGGLDEADAALDKPRELTRSSVGSRVPADEREMWAQRCILEALDRHRDRGELVHVTASAVTVSPRGVLLHMHKRLQHWTLPGGHVDPGEQPADSAQRETLEETGLPADHGDAGPIVVHLDIYRTARGHTHLEIRYLMRAPAWDPDPPPGESQLVSWFGWEEAFSAVDPGVAGALRSARVSLGT